MRSLIRRPQPTPTAKGNTVARRRSYNTFAGFLAAFLVVGYTIWALGVFAGWWN